MRKTSSLLIFILGFIGILSTMISTGFDNPNTPLVSAIGTLKYFTIQSNIIVTVIFALMFFKKEETYFLNKALGAASVYITITFLVFVTTLQATWHPTGLAQFGNILNHYIVPILTLGFLIYFRKDYAYSNKDIKQWLIYPLIYFAFLIIFGLSTGDYIYPFFDINEVGILSFIISFIAIIILFFILSLIAITITKKEKVQNV